MSEKYLTPLGWVEQQAYIRTITGQAGLRLEIDEPDSTPRTDGSTMWLPALVLPVTEEQAMLRLYYVLHECAHNISGKALMDRVDEFKRWDVRRFKCLNLVEDHRIERLEAMEYPGDALVFERGSRIAMRRFTEHVISNGTPTMAPADVEDYYKLIGAVLVDQQARTTWQKGTQDVVDELHDALPAPAQAYAQKLLDVGLVHYDETTTEEDVIELATAIFRTLWPGEKEERTEEEQAAAEAAGEGRLGEGEGSDEVSKALRSVHGMDGKRDSDGTDDDDGPVEGKKPLVPTFQEGIGGKDVNFDPWGRSGSYIPREVVYIDVPERAHTISYDPASSRLASRLRSLLQARSAVRYEGGYRSGKIDPRKVHRAALPTIGDGRWNGSVFQRKTQDMSLDTAVCLLSDFSGSMSGRRWKSAARAAAALNYALDKCLHMPVEILGFDDSTNPRMVVMKGYHERVTSDKLLSRYSGCMWEMGCNNADGESVAEAVRRLRTRKEKRKLLIVLSDGMPSSDGHGCDATFLRSTVQAIVDSKCVEVYGIGIESDAVAGFYPQHSVLSDSEDTERAVLEVLKTKLVNP